MPAPETPVHVNRDDFLTDLLRHISGVLQNVVGLKEAEGFISIVGQNMGDQINRDYRLALETDRLNEQQVAEVLVDLKRRIDGDFFVIEQTPEKIVLGNRRCPFGEKVRDRPALCMMTSNVFGVIAAENLGYARVSVDEAIARGYPGCRITVHLVPGPSAEGREYYASE